MAQPDVIVIISSLLLQVSRLIPLQLLLVQSGIVSDHMSSKLKAP